MFNPYRETHTGEPPTESSDGRTINETSAQTIVSSGTEIHQESSNLSLSNSSSRSLAVQEPDSGYEASPSSIAESQRFFGEQSNRQSEIHQSDSEDEYDIVESHAQILFTDSESDELEDYDTCVDCSSAVSCTCLRTDSSTTNATAMSNCDNSRCNSRPSSEPIQIPNLPSCRITSDVSSRIIIGSPIDYYNSYSTRSQPTDFSPHHRLALITPHHPLSWPSTVSPLRNNRSLSRNNSSNRDIPQSHRHNHPVRSRRQIIDSEASSYGSSEDEGPEDVFNMPTGEASSYPTMMTMSTVPLPDVVLESTDTGRRSRSMSINLPPDREQVLHDVGQRLRTMSDLFVRSRQLRMAVERARSRTTSECDDHLHRNGLS